MDSQRRAIFMEWTDRTAASLIPSLIWCRFHLQMSPDYVQYRAFKTASRTLIALERWKVGRCLHGNLETRAGTCRLDADPAAFVFARARIRGMTY